MNLNAEQKKDIISKQNRLEEIRPILKKEYKGIDDAIDQIIESIRPFYIFPKSLNRPLIVNLWGMTGIGKSSLVGRIVELLGIQHQYVHFDIGEYAHNTSEWKMRYDLSDKASSCANKHLVLTFDEFQLGRTIDDKGKEIDRSSLRPVWEVIDSGKICKFAERKAVNEILRLLGRCIDQGVIVKDGIVVENLEIYNFIMSESNEYGLKKIDFAGIKKTAPENMKNADPLDELYPESRIQYMEAPFFIKHWMFDELFKMNPRYFNNVYDYKIASKKFRKTGMTAKDIYSVILEHFVVLDPVMIKEDYSQSLIFIIGNLDEAYAMTHVVDPDDDADLLHEWSLKITTPKIKDALSQRYRMEQISRLGNNHIIYPSFNKHTYEEIIELYLNNRVESFKEAYGLYVEFDPNVNDMIYKEGVFPTQGTRPVLSCFSQFIDSYVALLVSDLALQMPDAETAEWSFDSKTSTYLIVAKTKGKKTKKFTYPVRLNLEKLRKSDYSQEQAHVAVHEAGHAVASIMGAKIMPTEVRSKTAGLANGFAAFKNLDVPTADFDIKQLVILLAGLEAEKLVFGDENIGEGGSSDLTKATKKALLMTKSLGMHDSPLSVGTEMNEGTYSFTTSKYQTEAEDLGAKLIHTAKESAKQLLIDNEKMLLDLSYYLMDHPAITIEDLQVFAAKYIDLSEIKESDNYFDFRGKIIEKHNELFDKQKSKKVIKALSHAELNI